jgi:hypothetical protein
VCIEALFMDEPTCPKARECFDTPEFYHWRFHHQLPILRAAHICSLE